MAKPQVPFTVAVGGGGDSSPVVAAAGSPPPVDSDSDREHPLQEPQFVFHAMDDDERHHGQQPAALLPIHHRRRRPRPAADEERLRFYMIMPQEILCSTTFILGGSLIYFANSPEVRAQPGFNWDVFVTAYSALVMLFSLVSLLLSYMGVYNYHG